MSPATLALIIQGIEAAIQAAPQVVEVAEKGKALISSLFTANAITVEQQNAVHAHIDAISEAALAGNVPPAWQVQADPGTEAAPAPVNETASAPAETAAQPPPDSASSEAASENKTGDGSVAQ